MRKIVALLTSVVLLLGCTACKQKPAAQTPPAEQENVLIKAPLLEEQIDALPIANADMSVEELRQLCLDYFKLQLEFPWTPDKDFTFQYKTSGLTATREEGVAYAGLPYVTGSYGNLYRIMKYYDSKTGVITVTGEDQEFANIIGNQCSVGAGWAWARVINNTTFLSTITMTEAQGCIKLGPYEYDTTMKEFNNVDTREICQQNGEQIMYQSYALWQPADGMVHYDETGHVQMVSTKPNVVYDADGNIDGELSTVCYMDQTATKGVTPLATEKNGELMQQGNVDKEITFKELYDKNYIPFTFAEFIGEGEVEASQVEILGYSIPENDLVFSDLKSGVVSSNYFVSDVRLMFKDKDGGELHTEWCKIDRAKSYTYSLSDAFDEQVIADMAQVDGATVDIVVRIGTGEKITVYSGSFSA